MKRSFALLLLLGAGVCAAQEPMVWRFESGEDGWSPRAATIAVSRAEGIGATQTSSASLRIRGEIQDGWNYATTPRYPMKAGQLYRLSAWLRVDKVGKTTPMPYLKCEFVSAGRGAEVGQVSTERYDGARMGAWQRLVVEFKAPETTERFWLAVEKGANSAAAIDAYLDEVTLEPIERLTALDKYRLKQLPAPLQSVRGVHPRIYLNKNRIAELQEAIETTHVGIWEKVRQQADRAVRRGAPAYREEDSYSGSEQLWQRNVGNTMPLLAMAYVLTGERKYLDSAREWALASCAYKTWGLGRIDGMDLATGHQLFGLGIVYDWCHDGLGEEARRTIRETLERRTSAMFEAAATGKVWWRRSYMQNHLWVNTCGMAVSGFALFDEVDDADMWISLPLEKFRRTMDVLGPDGASHEGVGYWEYGVEYMLKFMHLARELLGENLYDNEWWRNTAAYCQYQVLPRNSWTRRNVIVDIADGPRGNWYGPEYLLRALAREYRDGHAQWLADRIDEAGVAASGAGWLNLIWFDPAVKPTSPDALPTLRHFNDMDVVSARTGWSGDESLLIFKCGPFIGHEAVQAFKYDPGGGHVHPDANHFVLFGEGEWLIRDDGYSAKWTAQHNTLTIDGRGQLGEGRMWFNGSEPLAAGARPRILRAISTPALDQVTGDATEAYPSALGLRRYVRHALFLKPNVLIVTDDIVLDRARALELRFFPEHENARPDEGSFLVAGKKSLLRIEPLTPDGIGVAAESVAASDRKGEMTEQMFAVRLTTKRAAWRNAVALSWSAIGAQPPRVAIHRDGSIWTFTTGRQTAVLDWATGEASIRH